jgi:predicted transposase YbfD/YdcC
LKGKNITKETSKGRKEIREIKIYNNLKSIDPKWKGVQSIIEVTRKVKNKDKNYKEIHYFISSLDPKKSAKKINKGIRYHWGIESYHYVKDATLKEDASKVKKGNAPGNMSILRTMLINIYRQFNGYITDSIVRFGNNAKKLIQLILG